MRVLLDTNAFLYAVAEPARLGKARRVVESERNELLLSAVVAWEIAIKSGTGRLDLPDTPASFVARAARDLGCNHVPIDYVVALAVAALPPHHRDPFDRLLVAQAQNLRVPIVTSDAALAAYGVEIIRAG